MLDAITRALRLAGEKALGAILLVVSLIAAFIVASLAGELWDNHHTAILRLLAALVFALFLSGTLGQRDFRRRFLASFRSGEDPPEAEAAPTPPIPFAKFRMSLGRFFLVTGAIAAILCAVKVGVVKELAWWLIPAALLTAAMRLLALSLAAPEGATQTLLARMLRTLSANLFELLFTLSFVLTLYSLAMAWLATRNLDAFTLAHLIAWDAWVRHTYVWLHEHKLALKQFAILFAFVFALRLLAAFRPTLGAFAANTSTLIVHGVKWIGRISSIFAIAASLTLLSTAEVGDTGSRISISIASAEEAYTRFQSSVADEVDRDLREALVARVLAASPVASAALVDAVIVDQQRSRYDADLELVKSRSTRESEPASADKIATLGHLRRARQPKIIPETTPPSNLTPKEIESAESEQSPEHRASEAAADIGNESIQELLNLDKNFFEKAEFTRILNEHYPGTGPLLEAIGSSVLGPAFDHAREAITRQVIESRMQPDAGPIGKLIRSLTGAAAATRLPAADLNHFDAEWGKSATRELESYRTKLASDAESIKPKVDTARKEIAQEQERDAEQRREMEEMAREAEVREHPKAVEHPVR
jgi:hypothetical protein